ncbi:MAG: OmpH family outer membrane protein [Pseudomonadota bacterium]|nr:OmpH family outer membrane protein [Pseudomonadota bacterium]
MQNKLIHASLIVLFMAAAPAQAADLKIGYVDAIKLVEQAPQGEAALKKLEREFGKREKSITAKRDRARRLQADLDKTPTDKKAQQLRDLKRDLAREQQEFREDYSLRRNEELGKLQKAVTDVIVGIAKKEGYDLIVQNAVYFSPKVDMTDKVLKKLKGRK